MSRHKHWLSAIKDVMTLRPITAAQFMHIPKALSGYQSHVSPSALYKRVDGKGRPMDQHVDFSQMGGNLLDRGNNPIFFAFRSGKDLADVQHPFSVYESHVRERAADINAEPNR